MARTPRKSKGNNISDNHPILDGLAHVFRVKQSGDVWQFRMYVRGEDKNYRKSLRTRDLPTALQLGQEMALELQGKMRNGVKLFGLTLREFVDSYLEYRTRDVNARIIIDKLLRESDWVLSGDDGVVNVDTETQNQAGFADYVLKDSADFPICVIEAKKELVSPLVGKEQAHHSTTEMFSETI